MGNTKRFRKKYETPSKIWDKERITEEKEYIRDYGLKNKKEIWRMSSKLTKFKNIAKDVISKSTSQAEKEGSQLLSRLKSLGLLNEASMLSDVLTLSTKDILERRLQTVVFRKGLTHSVNQARQFIVHGHIMLNGAVVSSPASLVRKSEEETILFNPNSTLSDLEHPERKVETVVKTVTKKVKNKDKQDSKSEKDVEQDKKNDNNTEKKSE
jgi:small subunit ribosomal protein S4